MTIPSNWYEDFFHGVALDLWRKAIPPEKTKAEAEFLVGALECPPGSHLLDVPCGNGRLALDLARREYQMTGVDISEEFIREAQASAINVNRDQTRGTTDTPNTGTPVPQFFLGDMRRIEGEAVYDGGYCFGNSFGFLAYADMESFLNGIARALKPGARFVVETGMAAESIIPKFEEHASHQIEDILVTINEQYLAAESCVDSEYIFEREGKTEISKAKHWIYTAAEIRRMLERAGFEILDLWGSLEREPFVLGSDELYVVAQRVSAARP
jgi:SAM-dependent methyltransferase